MPYVYEVSFDVPRADMSELEIGQSLERLVGYMKVRLPAQRGFVYSDAVYSVDDPERIRVVMRSHWSDWSDAENHRLSSALVEDRVFEHFEPHVRPEDITIRRYAEVGSGPLAIRRDLGTEPRQTAESAALDPVADARPHGS